MSSIIEFGVLGPVEARVDGREVRLGGPRARAVLAALLLEPNRVVSIDTVVARAWGDDAPETARFQSQNRVSGLRRALREAGGVDVISTVGSGYVIRVEPEQLDVAWFDQQLRDARRVAPDDLASAARTLAAALRLWRGPALHGLATPRLLAAAQRLDESRLAAQELLVDLNLRRGLHHEVIGELMDRVTAHPWRELSAGQLMLALYRAGRRREALEAYERFHSRVTTELGVDPGQDLVRLRDQILRDDAGLAVAQTATTGTSTTSTRADRPTGNPRMLPRAVPVFVGREEDLNALAAATRDASTVAVCTVAGPPGVGKTALAVQWAHRVSAEFPDGQLFVNLRGYGPGAPLRAIDAVTTLLIGLGVPVDQIPRDEVAAVAQYRAVLADKRVLVVLDNAASADDVRPLLPLGQGSVAVVTSRDRLTGLTAMEGARPLGLGVLPLGQAVELLRGLLGDDRAGAEEDAVVDLATVCGGLPLALRIAAARLADSPERSIAGFVADLRAGGPLRGLAIAGDEAAAVGAALARSYDRLPSAEARLFRRLGLAPVPDMSTESAAVLVGEEVAATARALDRLVAAHLVERREADRVGLHDLTREYAAERAHAEEPADIRAVAIQGLFRHLAARATAASRCAFSANGVPVHSIDDFQDRAAAMSWLEVEVPSLVVVAVRANDVGLPEVALRLAKSMRAYLRSRHDHRNWHDIARAALSATTQAGDLRGQAEAAALVNVGLAYGELGVARAIESHRRALAVTTRLGRADSFGDLRLMRARMGELRPAVVTRT